MLKNDKIDTPPVVDRFEDVGVLRSLVGRRMRGVTGTCYCSVPFFALDVIMCRHQQQAGIIMWKKKKK